VAGLGTIIQITAGLLSATTTIPTTGTTMSGFASAGSCIACVAALQSACGKCAYYQYEPYSCLLIMNRQTHRLRGRQVGFSAESCPFLRCQSTLMRLEKVFLIFFKKKKLFSVV